MGSFLIHSFFSRKGIHWSNRLTTTSSPHVPKSLYDWEGRVSFASHLSINCTSNQTPWSSSTTFVCKMNFSNQSRTELFLLPFSRSHGQPMVGKRRNEEFWLWIRNLWAEGVRSNWASPNRDPKSSRTLGPDKNDLSLKHTVVTAIQLAPSI